MASTQPSSDSFEQLWHLNFATGALDDLLAPSRYRDCHDELIFLLNGSSL